MYIYLKHRKKFQEAISINLASKAHNMDASMSIVTVVYTIYYITSNNALLSLTNNNHQNCN